MRTVIIKKTRTQSDASRDAILRSTDDQQDVEPCKGGTDEEGLRTDADLVKRCVAGEVMAWEDLYARCHDPLMVSVRIMLGGQSRDANLVDEIAARVWYALVAKDAEVLSRYDSKRGARLITFLRALAKDEITRHFRGEVRRRKRELLALREKPRQRMSDQGEQVDSLAEFLSTLAPHERAFCNDYLLAEPAGAAERSRSEANVWQLSHLVYRKLLRFLDPRS